APTMLILRRARRRRSRGEGVVGTRRRKAVTPSVGRAGRLIAMMTRREILTAAGAALSQACFGRSPAGSVKIGFLSTLTGQNAIMGEHMLKGLRLYLDRHPDALPAGLSVQLITRDDGGPNPDRCKQLAQELIVREKVSVLAGI